MRFAAFLLEPFAQLALWLSLVAGLVGPAHATTPRKTGYPAIYATLDGLNALNGFWAKKSTPSSPSDTALGPDMMFEFRIEALNRRSVIPLSYDELVRKYIRIFAVERRDQISKMLGLADYYFPLFEEYLDRYRLPLELVYLAVVESALNPLAESKSGAVGLWQFKINTGKMFNLGVDSFIDDRMDPRKSTEAACGYLQYLYRLFDDWLLALAAYNAGPGTVQRAIARSGGERNFWKLLPQLPEAAQNYVPAFIAATYIFKHHEQHNIKKEAPLVNFRDVDTVMVSGAVSFETTSKLTGVNLELLYFLNPQFRRGYIPKSLSGPTPLVLPASATTAFATNEKRILSQSYRVVSLPFPKGNGDRNIRIEHIVAKGEYLHKIALSYDCTVNDLKRWNTIGDTLQPGDRLEVWVSTARYEALKNSD